jgi:hypothetical protein
MNANEREGTKIAHLVGDDVRSRGPRPPFVGDDVRSRGPRVPFVGDDVRSVGLGAHHRYTKDTHCALQFQRLNRPARTPAHTPRRTCGCLADVITGQRSASYQHGAPAPCLRPIEITSANGAPHSSSLMPVRRRRETAVTLKWGPERLAMGSWRNVLNLLPVPRQRAP